MPKRVVDAYMRFHDQLIVYNTVAGGFGVGYHKRCSIPQGCHFFMLIIAILLRPAILLLEIPGKLLMRILADDVIMVGLGHDNIKLFVGSYKRLLTFILDLGSKVSVDKSFLSFKQS